MFTGESSYLPVVSNLIMESQVPVNILFADTRDIDGHAHGQMLLQLPDDVRQAERAFSWLDANGITYSREE